MLLSYFDPEEPVASLSGDLPHWRQGGTSYFVTFRLADSLPQEKLAQWRVERQEWLRQHREPLDEEARREYYERFPQRLQQWLDAGAGSCLLAAPGAGAVVREALRHFDGQRYALGRFVVAANHVHVIVTPLGEHELSEILHSWKSYTAHQLVKLRESGMVGAGRKLTSREVWQKESFDHIVRSPESLGKFQAYIEAHREYRAPV